MSMANTIETNSTVKTTAVFSKNRKDRYLLKAECDNADVIIVAYGRSTSFEEEKKAFLNALTEHYNDKLHTIIDSKGLMFSHPLSPFAHQWNIQKLDLKR